MKFNNWKKVSLQEVTDKIGDGLHGTPIYNFDGEYYFINGNNLNSSVIVDQNTKKVGSEEYLKYKKELNDSTILLSINGTVGNLALYNNEKVLLSKSACYINVKKNIDRNFIYYLLFSNYFKHYIDSHSSGTTIKNLGLKEIREFSFSLPNKEEQNSISSILFTFDKKIDLNIKISKNLEELAQTLYKRWFVDFEFPNEKGEPYKSSGVETVDSELGLIPKGWEVKQIGEVFETVLGGTPSRSKKEFWGEGHQWLKSGELNNYRITRGTETITDLGLNSSATKLMPVGTTLIAITGYVGLVSMLEIEACANQSVVGIIPNSNYPRSFLYSMIKNDIERISSKQTGSAQQHINKNDINSHKFISPNLSIIKKFDATVENIHKKIAVILFESEKLAELRDLLLPKLMSGEIEVPIEE
jgi:type I restriction enzyme S subunit